MGCVNRSEYSSVQGEWGQLLDTGGQVLGQILREGELEGLSHLGAAEVEGYESPVRAAGDPAGRDLAVHACAAYRTSSAFGRTFVRLTVALARRAFVRLTVALGRRAFGRLTVTLGRRLSAACRSGFLARASSRAAFFALSRSPSGVVRNCSSAFGALHALRDVRVKRTRPPRQGATPSGC